MTINKEKIKKALDDFESEDYVSSKDTLKQEIRKKVNSYLQTELGTDSNPIDDVEDESEGGDDGED